MIVLNVGGGPSRNLPPEYDGWEQHLLDIDPNVNPDICCDARELVNQDFADKYDAIYCSHNLEHYYQYEVPKVLAGFMHVLKSGGIAEIQVPNLTHLMQEFLSRNHDINDVWYRAGDQAKMPITFHDVLYGWGGQLKEGNHYYAHKCGFTPLSLCDAVHKAGFVELGCVVQGANIFVKGVKPWPQ